MDKHWIAQAVTLLKTSREPVPHETNELDWKVSLSVKRDRLPEHLCAFANHPNGGYMVYGVADDGARLIGVNQDQVAEVTNTLTNLSRDAVEPPIRLDHAVVEYEGVPLLFVHIPEQANKPVHRRGKSIEETWIRSGGTTRKASRQEIGALMLNSRAPRWEDLRASPLLAAGELIERLDLSTSRPSPSCWSARSPMT